MRRILELLLFGFLIFTAFGCQEAEPNLIIDSDSVMIEMDEIGSVPVRLSADSTPSNIIYESLDDTILYVNDKGDIIPIAPGTAEINVRLEGTDKTAVAGLSVQLYGFVY
jgi:hypothetical protein